MSAGSLPPRPNFHQLQIQAKELLRAQREGDAEACARIRARLPRLEHLRAEEVTTITVSLQEVQHVLAREYGFRSWMELRTTVESITAEPVGLDELRAAIDREDVEEVQSIIETNPELVAGRMRFTSLDGEREIIDTPLSYATTWARFDVVDFLVNIGAPIDRTERSGMTAEERLRQSIEIGDVNWTRELLDGNPALLQAPLPFPSKKLKETMDIEGGGVYHNLPLTFACSRSSKGNLETVRFLIEAGADIHERDGAPIYRAVAYGSMPLMELLVEAGWDPATTPAACLLGAVENLHPDTLRFLITHGVDPDLSAKDGDRALDMVLNTYVLNERRSACVDTLIEAGARHVANAAFILLRGRLDLLEQCIDADPSCLSRHFDLREGREHYPHTYGGHWHGAPLQDVTLLHLCAHYGYLDAARLLFERGADLDARTLPDRSACNHTPLYHAVNSNWNFCYPVLEFLVENGANLNIRSTIRVDNGRVFEEMTPLEYAIEFPKEPFDIVPEGNGDRHEPHRRVVELLRKAEAE